MRTVRPRGILNVTNVMMNPVYYVTVYSICSVRMRYLPEGGPNIKTKNDNRIFNFHSKFRYIAGHFYRIVRMFASDPKYKTYAILKDFNYGKLYFKSCAACRFFPCCVLKQIPTNAPKTGSVLGTSGLRG